MALTISPVADAVADNVATNQNTPVSFNVLTGTNGASADNFEDPAAVVTAVTQGANGAVTFSPTGLLTYTPGLNFSGVDSFTYTVTAGGVTETGTVSVAVAVVNTAPVNTVPAAQAVDEDTVLVFSTANGNAISVADADSPTLTTTVSTSNGTLTAVAFGGAVIGGNGSASVTISGPAAAINGALNGLSYASVADFNGGATITVLTSDGGLSHSATIAVTISPVAMWSTTASPPPRARP